MPLLHWAYMYKQGFTLREGRRTRRKRVPPYEKWYCKMIGKSFVLILLKPFLYINVCTPFLLLSSSLNCLIVYLSLSLSIFFNSFAPMASLSLWLNRDNIQDEITVQWTAPEPGNGCIQLKASLSICSLSLDHNMQRFGDFGQDLMDLMWLY